MVKKLLLIGVIITVLMMISTPALADKKEDDKGKADNNPEAFSNIANAQEVGTERVYDPMLPTMAWGRYGPFSLSSGSSTFKRIYFGASMGGTPVVVCGLQIYPYTSKASCNADRSYTYSTRFDARVTSVSGYLSSSYIDYIALY